MATVDVTQKIDTTTDSFPREIIPILFINFISSLSFSIVLPFLFILVNNYGGNALIFGVLGASYSFFQLIGSPLLGAWSDKIGRRPILLLSHLGTLISWIIFLLALFLPINTIFFLSLPLIVLFLARILDGITGGNISVANAYLADVSTSKTRTRNFGYMAMASSIGFIIGPALSGIVSAIGSSFPAGTNIEGGIHLTIISAILLSIIGLFLIGFYLKPPANAVIDELLASNQPPRPIKRLKTKEILRLPHIGFLILINFVIFIAFSLFYASFPVFTILELGWTEFELGFFLTFLSFFMIIVQGPVLSRVSKKQSPEKLILLGNLILGIGFIFFSFKLGGGILYYIGAILFAIGNGLMYPSLVSTISKHAGEENQGAVQGLAGSSGSAASIVGLILGGALYLALKGAIFILSSLTFLFVTILSIRLLRMETQHQKVKSLCFHDFHKSSQSVEESCETCTITRLSQRDQQRRDSTVNI